MGTKGKQSILVLDDDQGYLDSMRRLLVSNGYVDIVTISNSGELLDVLDRQEFSVLLLDWIMPDLGGQELLSLVIEQYPDMPVIIMTGICDNEHTVSCIKLGAFDYISKNFDSGRIISCVSKACQFYEVTCQNQRLKRYLLGETLSAPETFSEILTRNPRMQAIFKIIETMSKSSNPVVITGETGVGKELFARAIHRASGVVGNFVALNVAGLDDLMFADTLFGHKKGAFTGAHESRDGLIAKAGEGTLFLDEIGDLGNESQVKLLRLLQEREYFRLGSDVLYRCDARIITASNVDFDNRVSQGLFRRDLYHRMRSHHIHVPPLRERAEDIPLLIDHYLKHSARSLGRITTPSITGKALDVLEAYHYPGNVRELVNLVHNAVACNSSDTLTLGDFSAIAPPSAVNHQEFNVIQGRQFRLQASFPRFPTLISVEKLLVDEALRLSAGNKSVAADLLGIARSTLHRKLADLG